MPDLQEWWKGFWDTVQHHPTVLPTRHAILPSHVDKKLGETFRRDRHYFTVRLNQIFLKYDRQFWATYAPMALVVSEFQYNGQDTVVPFVVGPSLLEKDKIEVPNGFVFSDTKVAGIHPYKGGGLKLTVILYRIQRNDPIRRLLRIAESLASVLDFSQTLGTYLKIANILVETLGDVIGADPNNQPIIGMRKEFDAQDGFQPGYFALIDSGNTPIEQEKLWVCQNQLRYGDSMNAPEYRGANFLLYSIQQATERDDIDQLHFYKQWQTSLAESLTASQEKWLSAKANWVTLYQMMSLSPDLISSHAEALADECYAQMEKNYAKIKERMGKMGAGGDEREATSKDDEDKQLSGLSEQLDPVRSRSVSVLRGD